MAESLQERMKADFVLFARDIVPATDEWYELSLVATVKRSEDGTVTLPLGIAMKISVTELPRTEPEPRSWWRRGAAALGR